MAAVIDSLRGMGLGVRLVVFAGVPIVGLAFLVSDDAMAVFAGGLALGLLGLAVAAWVSVLRSSKDIARRYVDHKLRRPSHETE